MEYIAATSGPPSVAPRGSVHTNGFGIERGSLRRPPEQFEMQEKKRKEQENTFLRSSLRKSKKLQALARNVDPLTNEPMKVTSFANPLAEVEETPSRKTENGATRITVGEEVLESSEVLIDEENKDSRQLDEVIISVERIASKLSSMQGRESDVAMLRDFFAAPPIQAAIEQTVKQNGKCGTTSSGIGTDSGGDSSSCTSSPIPPVIMNGNGKSERCPSTSSSSSVSPRNAPNVKVVEVVKDEDSYLGATVRNENNKIIVGRVVKGGIVEKMNLFQEGDELLELNGSSLKGKQVNEICDILRNLSGPITFVVAPKEEQDTEQPTDTATNTVTAKKSQQHVQHLRALFDYDPEDDVYVPCKELAMKFQRGDILHVLNTKDDNWWQAYRDGEDIQHSLAGLIPSSSFRQQVVLYADEVEREQEQKRKECKGKKKKKLEVKKGADEENLPAIGVYSDFLTYEEVVLELPKATHRRPIVLCGAEGVGCLKLRDRLLESDRITLACPVPYTSRTPKEGEFNGVHYHFVSKQKFHEDAKSGKFVEFGEYQKFWYGTAKKDVVNVIERGKTCVMTLKAESLGAIRSPDIQPYIIFIAAPSLYILRRQREVEGTFGVKDDELKAILTQSKSIEQKYGHLFDGIIVNIDFEKSFRELKQILMKVNTEPMWVPATWTAC
ncbi:MAGUK p55 subfamily member 5 [Caenorhabditis elegans]|nr:MAGUK p55 subfamily member 5 [Caenorhabditis elegans]CCD62085.1 MAGUK p55 subfamily member 5 [Caenorhabditis elegans]|eukprot:NP_505265.1 MAGUK family [Caenorhabditis elegans]